MLLLRFQPRIPVKRWNIKLKMFNILLRDYLCFPPFDLLSVIKYNMKGNICYEYLFIWVRILGTDNSEWGGDIHEPTTTQYGRWGLTVYGSFFVRLKSPDIVLRAAQSFFWLVTNLFWAWIGCEILCVFSDVKWRLSVFFQAEWLLLGWVAVKGRVAVVRLSGCC